MKFWANRMKKIKNYGLTSIQEFWEQQPCHMRGVADLKMFPHDSTGILSSPHPSLSNISEDACREQLSDFNRIIYMCLVAGTVLFTQKKSMDSMDSVKARASADSMPTFKGSQIPPACFFL